MELVLIIQAHPRSDSFCAALARELANKLEEQEHVDVLELRLPELTFDPHVRTEHILAQPLEPDLEMAREWFARASHIFFVYPIWWGTMPALLKGFLDRILLPGFAFRERPDGMGFEGLLHGKSATLITTMDTPPWVVRYILRSPGHRAMSVATLQFCGIRPVRTVMLGPVNHSTEKQRLRWLRKVGREARFFGKGSLNWTAVVGDRGSAWLQALRLQFYLMTWISYTVGGLTVMKSESLMRSSAYWLGFAALFLIEAITVFINEQYDFESDRKNKYYGPFNGGSRVLVDRRLSLKELMCGVAAGACALAVVLILLLRNPEVNRVSMALLACIGLFLGIGYTLPPMKFSHRAAGEIVVGLTHSFLVILVGVACAGGSLLSATPWGLGVPLFLAVLPAITLSGIPDAEADLAAGKQTLVAKWGLHNAYLLAGMFAAAAILCGLLWHWTLLHEIYGAAIYGTVLHGAGLLAMLYAKVRQPAKCERINALMVISLSFILWFGLVPLFRLW